MDPIISNLDRDLGYIKEAAKKYYFPCCSSNWFGRFMWKHFFKLTSRLALTRLYPRRLMVCCHKPIVVTRYGDQGWSQVFCTRHYEENRCKESDTNVEFKAEFL